MTARPSPRLTAVLIGFAWGAIGVVVAINALALLASGLSIDWLQSALEPARVSMNPTAAVGLMLAGVALALLMRQPGHGDRRRVAMVCAGAVVLLGAVKLLAYWLPLHIDHLLTISAEVKHPMPPNAAVGLITCGLAVLFLDVRIRGNHRPTVWLALGTAAIGSLAITGYLYDVTPFYKVLGYIPMALNTATSFLLMSLAILAARPQFEPVATILSDTAGGVVARRLLPAAAGLPLLVGWLCLMATRGFAHHLGITFYSLIMSVIFLVLTWGNARFLHRLDVERHRAERKAAEEHHLLRSLIDNLPDLVFVKDSQSRFLVNNIAHAQRLGAASPEEMHGKHDRDYFEPALAEEYFTDEKRIMETGIPLIDKEQFFVDRAGTPRWVIVTKVPLRDTRGKIIGTFGIAHEITARKQAEEERDRFFTLSADIMCVARFDGFFIRINSACETTLGYTPAEMTSRPWLEFVHPDDRQATINESKKLSLGAVTLYFENRYRCKDGQYRWLSWTAVPVVREQRIYAVARDTTERRRVVEKLREAVESERNAQQSLRQAQGTMVQTEKLAGLGQMVAGVAHEINNPLSFVSNNVAVLQRDLRAIPQLLELYGKSHPILAEHAPPLLAEITELAEHMDLAYTLANLPELFSRSREGLRRIQQIVKDLRDFARLDESDLHEVDLNDGIRSTITIIQGHAKKHGIRIDSDLGNLPPVTCYPAKVNQVVMNLLTNAIDASPPQGVVTVRTRAEDDSAIIQVSDTGSGIDPAIRERIFDPFFTTKPQGQGTGLGLSISYGIVRDHGGTIEVESEVGKGSTFTVKLPMVPEKLKGEVRAAMPVS